MRVDNLLGRRFAFLGKGPLRNSVSADYRVGNQKQFGDCKRAILAVCCVEEALGLHSRAASGNYAAM